MSLLRTNPLFPSLFGDHDAFSFGRAPASDFFRHENLWNGPRIDVHEEEKQFVVTAEVPGVKKEDIKINLDADRRRLTLEGQMRSEYTRGTEQTEEEGREVAKVEGKVGTPLVSERMFGSFSRTFTLPPTANLADEKACKARYSDGILKLEIPKRPEEQSQTRQVMIEDA